MPIKTSKLDIAEHLEDDEDIYLFLQAAAEDNDIPHFIHALGTAARAKGMTEIAKTMGVSRTSLYKSLKEDGSPQYETIKKIVDALGCKITITKNSGTPEETIVT